MTSRRLKNLDSYLTITKDILTIVAILVGAVWFLLQREAIHKSDISHEIEYRTINDDWKWVQATVTIENTGKRVLDFNYASIKLQKILPLDQADAKRLQDGTSLLEAGDYTIKWPRIGDVYRPEIDIRIEPGERQTKNFDFIIPSRVQTIRIYSYFSTTDSRKYGWTESTILDVSENCAPECRDQ